MASNAWGSREHHRSLRSKLVLGVAVILFALFVLCELAHMRIIQGEFVALEQQEAIRDLCRVEAALLDDLEHLREAAEYTAKQIARPEPPTDVPRSADWGMLVTTSGDACWIQPPNSGLAEVDSDWSTPSRLLALVESSVGRGGGITDALGDDLSLFVSVPIPLSTLETGSDAVNPSTPAADREFLILGRTLDEGYIDTLHRRTQVAFSIERLEGAAAGGTVQSRSVTRAEDGTMNHFVMPMFGSDSKRLANLSVEISQEITSHARHANALVRNYFLFGSVAALLALLWLLQRLVIAPVAAIREHTEKITEQGLGADRLVLGTNDEIGELAKAFDRMTERLSDAQQTLRDSSRAAGARQVAETVIHNIGNVLTNVNSLLDSANAQVAGLRVQPLDRLATRLESSKDERELWDATPRYLRSLSDSLVRDQRALGELLGTLGGNLRHIHDVIRAQREYARPSITTEPLVIGDVVREAIDCCQAKLESDQVSVRVGGAMRASIQTDRAMLLQVMINIIGNARESLRMKQADNRELRIEIEESEHTLQVTFEDNGIGMDRETLQRVFEAHFTTRSTGSGLGLHFCALTVSRLGGGMRALSDGPGQGATFVIELPRVLRSEPSAAGRSTQHSSPHSLEVGA